MSEMPPGIRVYLDNAVKASGKSEPEMLAVLSKSGLKNHGELRSHAMEALGLGHGHANALAAYYLKPEWRKAGAAAPKKVSATPIAKKAPAKKKPAKKPAAKK
jgi:hypothetical protein